MRRLLIANRGEIAVRITRACRVLGIESVAVYSQADAEARHVRLADMSLCIGPAEASKSYLDIHALLAAVAKSGADAVHPGYGFLSENPDFAQAVEEAGVTWVGPPAAVIATMNSKTKAKEVARAAGVPSTPARGLVELNPQALQLAGEEIGYPLLVKPEHGGGGKGMQRVDGPGELAAAVATARRVARGAFASDHLLLERLVEPARHVEVQILADQDGRVEHLFERDCSLQRRYQKVIEESPCPVLSETERKAIWESGRAIARQISYVGVGTVEFLFDPTSRRHYFLEMNTRLQVEHPVTEAVVGLDLAIAQLRIARGESLETLLPTGLQPRGHAIEARVYAEDPETDYAPQTGVLRRVRWPDAPFIRVDTGYEEGDRVDRYYDPMLAKIIAWGDSREAAIDRLVVALRETLIHGVTTNLAMLIELLQHPDVRRGDLHINSLAEIYGSGNAGADNAPDLAGLIVLAAAGPDGPLAKRSNSGVPDKAGDNRQVPYDPWTTLSGFRLSRGGKAR